MIARDSRILITFLKKCNVQNCICSHMTHFKDAYLSADHSHTTANDMWIKLKISFVEAVERLIPSINGQNKIQSAMDRCNDLTTYNEKI